MISIKLILAFTICIASPLAIGQLHVKGALQLDPQSYSEIPETVERVRGPLPFALTLERMMPQAGNQGPSQSCVAWAASYQKAYRIYQASDRAHRPDELLQSPQFLYSGATEGKCSTGIYVADALRFLAQNGSLLWSQLPNWDDACPNLGSLKSFASNPSVASYRLSTSPAIALSQIRTALADGSPVIMALKACKELENPLNGRITSFDSKDTTCQPHAVLAVGYDDRISSVRILNSWGRQWGDFGKVWIANDVLQARLLEAYVDFGPGRGGPGFPYTGSIILPNSDSYAALTKPTSHDILVALRSTISGNRIVDLAIAGVKVPVAKYAIWLNLPAGLSTQVSRVEYIFHHQSFHNPKRSVNGSSIFLAEWPGYGCISSAKAIAFLKTGGSVETDFNFCDILRSSNIELEHERNEDVVTNLAKQVDQEFHEFFTKFASDANFARAHSRSSIAALIPVVYDRPISSQHFVRERSDMSVKTALSMGRVGQNVLNGLPTGDASLYVDDKIGGFVGCAHGAVADLQCSEGGSPMDFERDELGNWWLSGIYKQPEYRVFNPKTDLGLPTFVERRPR